MKEIYVLGEKYTVERVNEQENIELKECYGYCDSTTRRIVISNARVNVDSEENFYKKVLRHEIIHAFLYESGLSNNFEHCYKFGHEETMVDWLAIQFPKILKVYEELNIL